MSVVSVSFGSLLSIITVPYTVYKGEKVYQLT